MINRDRALEVMWYIDAFFDEYGYVKYENVKDKVTQKEWMITQIYFNSGYTADYVIENLKRLPKNEFPIY